MLDRCATVELLPTALWAPHLCHLGPCRAGVGQLSTSGPSREEEGRARDGRKERNSKGEKIQCAPRAKATACAPAAICDICKSDGDRKSITEEEACGSVSPAQMGSARLGCACSSRLMVLCDQVSRIAAGGRTRWPVRERRTPVFSDSVILSYESNGMENQIKKRAG